MPGCWNKVEERDRGIEGWRDGEMEGWREGGRDRGIEGWRDRGLRGNGGRRSSERR